MGSAWRETASQQAQDQFGVLVDGAFGTAQDALRQHGAFLPFAVAWPTGATAPEVVQLEGSGDVGVVMGATLDHLKERRDELDAYAVVMDASAVGTPGISVQLEHREGVALNVLQAYRKKKLGRGLEFSDDLASEDGERHVWG